MPAWRAKAHHLTRSRVFLGKAAAVILGVCALVAALLHIGRQSDDPRAAGGSRETPNASFETILREDGKRLEALPPPATARLIGWVRDAGALWMSDEPAERSGFDAVALRLGGMELHPLITRHTTSEAQAEAVAAYVRFLFLPDGDARKSALHGLRKVAMVREGAPAHANEMYGDALFLGGAGEEALHAYLREVATPDASHARVRAMQIALAQQATEVLERLCSDERVVAEMDPAMLWRAAKLTGDRRLLFRGLWGMQWGRWMQGAAVPLALLAAAIWYVILIHTASREPLRWWRYLPSILGGIASVWMLKWWQGTLNYFRDPENAPSMMHELVDWIMRVGLPEETAKLLLFTFFLPVLLHQKSGVKAALTAGCVGLGFALDENLLYFREKGPQVAIGRLLTANFVHVSLTGIVGWHFYELFRSRFHHATEFLTAFCAVVVAHSLYDFATGSAAMEWGFNIAGIIILALSARHYLPLLHRQEQARPTGHAISRSAVFLLGTSLLSGLLMIVMVWEMRSLDGILEVLQQMIGVALVALIYIREWRELD
jgi:protease PrsW